MTTNPIADVFADAASRARMLLGDQDQHQHDKEDYAAHREHIQSLCQELESLAKRLNLPDAYREPR